MDIESALRFLRCQHWDFFKLSFLRTWVHKPENRGKYFFSREFDSNFRLVLCLRIRLDKDFVLSKIFLELREHRCSWVLVSDKPVASHLYVILHESLLTLEFSVCSMQLLVFSFWLNWFPTIWLFLFLTHYNKITRILNLMQISKNRMCSDLKSLVKSIDKIKCFQFFGKMAKNI